MESGRVEPLRAPPVHREAQPCLQPPHWAIVWVVACGVGILKIDGFLGNIHETCWVQDVPPLPDHWKWGGAIGAWILSPAQVDALNPKP